MGFNRQSTKTCVYYYHVPNQELIMTAKPNRWMNAGVYSITCLKTGRIYIRASKSMNGCLHKEKNKLKAGTHPNTELQADFTFYPDMFVTKLLEIIDMTGAVKAGKNSYYPETDQFRLETRAYYWMKELKTFIADGGYNNPDDHLVKPRVSSMKGKKNPHSEETRKKMSQAHQRRHKLVCVA